MKQTTTVGAPSNLILNGAGNNSLGLKVRLQAQWTKDMERKSPLKELADRQRLVIGICQTLR